MLIGALNATNAWELRAHSGKDGSVVWSCALETAFDNFFNLVRKAPAPVVADLDSDGHPEVLLAHDVRLPRPGPNLWFDRRLIVWDGRTGKLRWSHVWQEESDQYRTPIMAVRLGGERGTGVCVVEGRLQRAQLVLLDAQGSEVDRLKVNLRHWPAQVRVADVDSNGVDEILFLNNEGNLVAHFGGVPATCFGKHRATAWPRYCPAKAGSPQPSLSPASRNSSVSPVLRANCCGRRPRPQGSSSHG